MNYAEIEERLNKLYWTDVPGYTAYLNQVKAAGYKVLRNGRGIHKVQGGLFGDIVGGIFNGGNNR